MTTVTFEQFLSQNKSRFARIDAESTATIHPNAPVDDRHINAAEMRLGVQLPASYKTFLRVCGSGQWCGGAGRRLSLRPGHGDWEGFVALVHNVGGLGNFVAMNPREQTAPGEWALYYCSHDPFGFGRIADSFESWTREAVTAFEENDDL
ncbi:MAG TPA: SMI1/KNR4 family protein [Vicinamibacterales bacterium]|jgi:hypothetical protein